MVFVITFFMLVLFSAFFYLIGLWYLALLPIAVFIFMLSHGIKNIFTGIKVEILWEKWSLILIWLVTMVGLSGILFFVGVKEISVYLILLAVNIFLRLGSYLFSYEDGKLVFEIGTWILNVIILGTVLFEGGIFAFFETITVLAALMLGVYSFLWFIIGIFFQRENRWSYVIAILGIVVLSGNITGYFYPAEWIIPVGFLVLSLFFIGVYVVQHWEMPTKQTANISVRRILAGERIYKKLNVPKWKVSLYEWLENSPKWFNVIFEYINLGLLVYLLVFFFRGVFTSSEIHLGLWYWLGIALFLINTFLLKRVGYASDASRFALALIANFVLYSILLISGSSLESVLPFLIIWGFLCQVALFFVDRVNLTLFSEKDYLYRTIVTFIAFVCNIILLCRIDLPTQFLFSLIFVYVGIELLLMYYIVRFLNERKDAVEDADDILSVE